MDSSPDRVFYGLAVMSPEVFLQSDRWAESVPGGSVLDAVCFVAEVEGPEEGEGECDLTAEEEARLDDALDDALLAVPLIVCERDLNFAVASATLYAQKILKPKVLHRVILRDITHAAALLIQNGHMLSTDKRGVIEVQSVPLLVDPEGLHWDEAMDFVEHFLTNEAE